MHLWWWGGEQVVFGGGEGSRLSLVVGSGAGCLWWWGGEQVVSSNATTPRIPAGMLHVAFNTLQPQLQLECLTLHSLF